jgi:antitoxin CptB
MDLALGQFADAHLPELSDNDIAEFETWLDLPDPDILSWITGEAPTPAAFDTPLFARLRAAPRDALAGPAAAL